ncbi:MAG: hypothetical protein IJN39_05705 [Clostridia bacterium]|nr:hypothetical protein [Clostridia bacterium]
MNNINKFKKYADMLDEVYTSSSKTGVLESGSELFRQGANASEIVIPKMNMDGLGDYSRNSGYTEGAVELTFETKSFDYERGRAFSVDAMDNEETAGVAFGSLAGEFIRTKVVPELDAVRFAKYAKAGETKSEALTDAEGVLSAIRAAKTAFDDAEVPESERYLFLTPALKDIIDAADITVSKEVLNSFEKVICVPKSRFNTEINLLDGVSEGEEAGGFTAVGDTINFMAVHKGAVVQITKHAAPKVITPDQNQNADAYKYGYRIYGLCDVFENKAAGIYTSVAA